MIASKAFSVLPRLARWLILGAGAIQLTACGTTPEPSRSSTFSMPPGTYGYVVGQPYTIYGKRYYPKEEFDYDRTGIASWYGPNFHGKRTASGEIYNQDDMTAAHTTLQMPAMVEVTNLENGRKIRVRLNDRGPYHDDRIIDLSKRAAEELGMMQNGVAKVRVRVLGNESQSMKQIALGQMPSRSPTLSAHAPPETAKNQPPPLAALTAPLQPPPPLTPDTPRTPVATIDPPSTANAVKVEELPPPGNVQLQPPPSRASLQATRPTNVRQPLPIVPPDRSAANEPTDDQDRNSDDNAYIPPRGQQQAQLSPQEPPVSREPRVTQPVVTQPAPMQQQPIARHNNPPPQLAARAQPEPARTSPAKSAWNPTPNAGQKFYVQAGSFATRDTATQAERNLAPIGKVQTVQAAEKKGVFYRVRLGPYASADESERQRKRVVAKGYATARIVTD